MNHWQPETANPRGAISFASAATRIPGQTGRSPHSYAAALLGLVGSYSKSIQFLDMKTREWQLAWYFRDRWQATGNLTLTLGLHYEYYPLINRDDRGIERWTPELTAYSLKREGLRPFPPSFNLAEFRRLRCDKFAH